MRRLLALSGTIESAFVKDLTVQQGTFNRWKTGTSVPNKPADVALFATETGRNVLEAFVAAGMLTELQAGRGLPAESRRFLASLSEDSSTVDIAMAAHPDQGDIAGEQDRRHET